MNVNKNYLLVINPISGGKDKSNITARIRAFASVGSIHLTVYETTGEDDESRIRSVFKTEQFERAIIAGGDGTIKMATEAFEDLDIIFGILPSGSANGLAKDLELPEDLEESLQIAFYGNPTPIDIISINGMRCLHLSDIGLNARLIKNYEEGTIRGKLGYTLQTIKTLSQEVEPIHAIIEWDDHRLETDASVIIIANSKKYGTGVVINPDGKIDDGKFEIVVFKDLDWIMVGKILLGNMPIEHPNIEIISTDKARITASTLVNFQIDGEYRGEINQLDIKVLPRQLKIAVRDTVRSTSEKRLRN